MILAIVLPLLVTCMGLLGLIVTLFNISDAMRDLMLGLTGVGGPLVSVVAWNNVRNELSMAAILFQYILIGTVGLITPANPAPEADIGRVLVTVMYVGVEVLIVVNSFANRWDRHILRGPTKRADSQ